MLLKVDKSLLMLSMYICRLYFIMAPKRNLRRQPKKGVKKVESKRRGGSTAAAPDSKRQRTTRQKSKSETESTKLRGHVPLSSPPSDMPIDAPKERMLQDADIDKGCC
ncbi:uncharacterized protein LOC132805034 [Ziziphus jujuba]|uniref:Uncharacterized protein LOC132805034 n=1 Tax=Ziziphus jujuba TaxID=326968 RepID=A0ABM4AG98_ZIZJJ|nr:uncharacterized protein LOC132805034 [Ziziphus jujuba]